MARLRMSVAVGLALPTRRRRSRMPIVAVSAADGHVQTGVVPAVVPVLRQSTGPNPWSALPPVSGTAGRPDAGVAGSVVPMALAIIGIDNGDLVVVVPVHLGAQGFGDEAQRDEGVIVEQDRRLVQGDRLAIDRGVLISDLHADGDAVMVWLYCVHETVAPSSSKMSRMGTSIRPLSSCGGTEVVKGWPSKTTEAACAAGARPRPAATVSAAAARIGVLIGFMLIGSFARQLLFSGRATAGLSVIRAESRRGAVFWDDIG